MSVTSPENERARTKTWEEGRTECNRRRIRWTVAGRHPFRAPGPTHSIQDDDGSWEELPTLLPTSSELEGAYCFWNRRSSAAASKLPQNAIQRIGPTAPVVACSTVAPEAESAACTCDARSSPRTGAPLDLLSTVPVGSLRQPRSPRIEGRLSSRQRTL